MAKSSVSTIFWDIGAVLFSEAQLSLPEFTPVRELIGVTSTQSDEIFDKHWEHGIRLGKVDENTYWKSYLEISKNKPSLAEIKKLYRRNIQVNQELFLMAKKLSKAYDSYILSNHSSEWVDYLVGHFNLSKYFKAFFCSAYIGCAKPDPRYFEFVLKITGKNPHEIAFVDDNNNNIRAAQKFGIHGIVHRDNHETVTKLEALLRSKTA